MNKEQQRIAIAEYCGLTEIHTDTEIVGYPVLCGFIDGKYLRAVPDYLTDLNAMHEAERRLTIESFAKYESRLCESVDATGQDPDVWFYVLTATAAQRAEALLRTIGKWTETPTTTNI